MQLPLCKTQKIQMNIYLVPLVWFGHPALWNHLHSVHFVVGEVCHLIASSKATLGRDKHDQLTEQQVENLQ